MKSIFIATLTVLLSLSISSLSFAASTAQLDRSTVSLNETVRLVISTDRSKVFSKPDISSLNKDFSVLGSSQSSKTNIINGSIQSTTFWTYQLAPKQLGIIAIAPIEVSGEKTQALQLNVKPAQNNIQSGVTDAIFTEIELDRDSAYVQQQILLTIRINDSKGMREINLENIQLDDAFIKEVSNTSFDRAINGRNYRTYQIQYAIFAQKSGTLNIPPINIHAQVIDNNRRSGFFGPATTPVRFITESKSLTIKPPLNNNVSNTWLAAKNLQVNESWSQDPNSLQVGDSITRTIIVSATGLTGEQLPSLEPKDIAGVKYYNDQADVSDKVQGSDIVSRRTEKHTLVFTEAGTINLPAVNIEWFNTETESLQQATLKSISFRVKPNPALQQQQNNQNTSASNQTVAAATNNTNQTVAAIASENNKQVQQSSLFWQLMTAVGFLLAAIFAALLAITYRKLNSLSAAAVPESSQQHFDLSALKKACSQQQHSAIKQQLMLWAKQHFAPQAVYSLSDIKRLTHNESLNVQIDELERSCYGHKHQLSANDLYHIVEGLEKAANTADNKGLKSLYPT